MSNLHTRLRKLFPEPRLDVGTVEAVEGGVARVLLPGGGRITARGEATVGDRVFVKGGAIEGPAPNLPHAVIEV